MSGATEAAAALRAKALADHRTLASAVQAYRAAWQRLSEADDLNETLLHAATLALAAEAVNAAAKAVEDGARAALADCMAATGCTIFRTQAHTVSLTEGRRSAVVTDPQLVPAEYMTPAKPDRTAIAGALRRGELVPGCTLSNGGPPYVKFYAFNREKPA